MASKEGSKMLLMNLPTNLEKKTRPPLRKSVSSELPHVRFKSSEPVFRSTRIHSVSSLHKDRIDPLVAATAQPGKTASFKERSKSVSLDLEHRKALSKSVPSSSDGNLAGGLLHEAVSNTLKNGSNSSPLLSRPGSRTVWQSRKVNNVETPDNKLAPINSSTISQSLSRNVVGTREDVAQKSFDSSRFMSDASSVSSSHTLSSSSLVENDTPKLSSDNSNTLSSSLPENKSTSYWKLLKNRIKECQPADIVTSCLAEETTIQTSRLPHVRRQTFPFQSKGSKFYNTVLAAQTKARQRKVRKAWTQNLNKATDKDGNLLRDQLSELEQFKPKFKCSPHFQQTLNTLTKDVNNMLVEDDEAEEDCEAR